MRAAILSIGDELVLGQTLDTNSAWLAARLGAHAVIAAEHRTVPDDRARIADAIGDLAKQADVLIVTGGLGPTADDLTREALNDVLHSDSPMVLDEGAAETLRRWFSRRARSMPEMNLKQAMRPNSAKCIENPHGTAPGLCAAAGSCTVFCLPGPPREMQPMFEAFVAPLLSQGSKGDVLLTAAVHEYGMGESAAAEKLGNIMDRTRDPLVGMTVSQSIVSARVRSSGSPEAIEPTLRKTVQQIEAAWFPYAYGRDETTLAESVGALFRERKLRLVTAESCTGGLLGKMIVDIPGSSEYYAGGWVTYSNQMKVSQLGVSPELLESHGAVSAQVAQAMADGALRHAPEPGADCSLAITGIAGPDGGTSAKPVGTVFITVALRSGGGIASSTRRFLFAADRSEVRDRSAKSALQMLRFALLDVADTTPLIWEQRSKHSEAQAAPGHVATIPSAGEDAPTPSGAAR